jgi:hypothetical protein
MDFLLKIIEINRYFLYNVNILIIHQADYLAGFLRGV